ncbi:MAG: helix-turn-helix transcriptional regulator [Lachnospiraceae bacterium]|nr:helix-turn-helix transcriptional regulator [Lachnospiraceae bacterium]
MQLFTSYKAAFQSCVETQTFSVAHLYHLKKDMNIDTSGCYKIFFPLTGKKKFHIDNHIYNVECNDLFFITPREWHYFSHFDDEEVHERYVIFIFPDYLKSSSSSKTDLTACFSHANADFPNKLTLSEKERERFIYYIRKLSSPEEYGSDLLDHAVFLRLMVLLNRIAPLHKETQISPVNTLNLHNKTVDEIIAYLNTHITEDLSLKNIAEQFYISPSYLCKTFKNTTGTTIHKYITAQRITLAKDFLSEGHPIIKVSAMCGFNDYNAFLKAFTKEVGISPKKYSQFSV